MQTDYISHVGVGHDDSPPGRGSGRYGWGSGKNPGQHQFNLITEYNKLKNTGLTDGQIATILLGPKKKSVDIRAQLTIAKAELRQINREKAMRVLDECDGNISEAARRLNMKNESSLRSLIDPIKAERNDRYQTTADMIKKSVDKNGIVDISSDANLMLGVPKNTMDVAVAMLENQGYVKTYVKVPQLGTQHETSIRVLAKPDMTYGDIQKNKLDVKPINEFTPDSGKTWWTPEFPESMSSDRVLIRYNEEGGREKDGVIEIRKGVEDLSLDGSNYAQVRIAVDGTHYMKGMAMYADDIPKGYDVIYNTNKSKGTPKEKVFKELKIDAATGEVDRDNPFGALIKGPKERDGEIMPGGQHHYKGKDGKDHLSPINKLQEEGDWDSWSRTLSSQFLAKQPLKLINQQLDVSIKAKQQEFDQIMGLTNPVVKKKLLEEFARKCDANASDLSAKGFKNQAFQVILPVTSMKDTEIYAPQFKNGETVALVRYPHGGIFEIPVLKVNNNDPKAKKILGDAKDAIGININVCDRLSGADMDGDTALVIPMTSNKISISSSKPLKELEGFDGKALYKLPDDAPKMKSKTKQTQMGIVSNLITDMTVGGADSSEIAKAVRHSMVVIDAEKHHLDYKQSEKDHDILELKKKYQGVNEKTGQAKGASTILSKSGSEARVPNRKELTDVKKMTPEQKKRWDEGKIVWVETGEKIKTQITDPKKMTSDELELYKAGKKVYRETSKLKTTKTTKMDTVDDATELVRDKNNPKEMAYANYANNLKDLANQARKESRAIKPIPVNQSAKKTYAKEVASLNAKVTKALSNNPKERQAQVIANKLANDKLAANPDMDYEHRQRVRAVALNQGRAAVGAKKEKVTITDKEWEAIQANAISTNKLTTILNNADSDAIKKLATPKSSGPKLTVGNIAQMKAMIAAGKSLLEIAEKFGVSPSAVSNAVS